MKKFWGLFISILFLLSLTVLSQQSWASDLFVFNQKQCTPQFPLKDGWLGGDGIYSVAISRKKSLWFFGDTLIHPKGGAERKESLLIYNTVGISHCEEDGTWSIDYHWKNDADQKPKEVFPLYQKKTRLWPKDAIYHNGKVYAFFDVIKSTQTNIDFPFEVIGTEIAIIHNPNQSFDQWNITQHSFLTHDKAFPAVSLVKKSGFLYMYTVLAGKEHPTRPVILLRLPLSMLSYPELAQFHLQYYNKGWHNGLDVEKAQVLFPAGATELSVRYHKQIKKWVAILNDPNVLGQRAQAYTSQSFSGPFVLAKTFPLFEEVKKDTPIYDKDTFCYASKEHIQFYDSRTGQSLFTYACNSFEPNKLLESQSLYIPRVIPFIDSFSIQ